ncbi:MAG: polymerase, sigma-24 subunit, subfamily [Labilithrix sp.]|nr:polymerase, sigma-24 subunit, subfamily [Labilithrix sp.]
MTPSTPLRFDVLSPPDPHEIPDVLGIVSDLARTGRGELVRVARREGASPEDAVECVQDALCTFLQVAQKRELPADTARWSAYLAGVVRNAARNKRRLHHVAKPHDDLDALPLPLTAGASAESLIAEAEEHVRLRACVDQLCETQKAVVMLRLLEEQPGEDVAASLGITRGYVDVLLHRAKASLRVCMTDER